MARIRNPDTKMEDNLFSEVHSLLLAGRYEQNLHAFSLSLTVSLYQITMIRLSQLKTAPVNNIRLLKQHPYE